MDFLLDGLRQAITLLLALDQATISAIQATLETALLAVSSAVLLGVPAGFLMGYFTFPGRRALRLVVDTLLAFPTVVIGLVVYAFLTRRGPLGDWGLLFTIPGMAIGLTILGLPIVISMTAVAMEGLDDEVRQTILTLGASRLQAALACLAEARYAIALAVVTAFGRIATEVGIAMMVGGNIKWYTRTMTTAIALETGKGEFAQGIALGVILLLIAFCVNVLVAVLRRRGAA
ncbi:ABC-type transporter, integral membrane subunit [Desulfovibrio sp. X2]|uniref:ABC transporter permease n=1 Tax=Desulfovibrio sp. X2 TaxID=941449 RepID=UPI000358B6ED|nr:ABC transporter permease [Desulfovibrio sp. X2]EPR37324.1 ABC-type transporter, integral membrane subunit [Desulfovibrio sp. X2]